MHRLTKTPWFGPKKYIGWGWRVVSWEGRVASAVFLALVLVGILVLSGSGRIVAEVCVLAAFLVLVVLTGDPPGGPRSQSRSEK